MATGFTLEMYTPCASYDVRCNGDRVIQVVHHADGTVSFELAPPTAGGSIVSGGIIRTPW